MNRARPARSLTSDAVARVQAWLAESDRPRRQIAEQAGVHEKSLRLALARGWNPTARTLQKLEALIPANWTPAARAKRAA